MFTTLQFGFRIAILVNKQPSQAIARRSTLFEPFFNQTTLTGKDLIG